MFYYRIAVTEEFGDLPSLSHIEALNPNYVGEKLASILTKRPFCVAVEPINQATYIQATRRSE